MTSESDHQYFDQLAVRIERLGAETERRSNLVSLASRLLALRQDTTDPRDVDQLDLEVEAMMQLLDGAPADPPATIDADAVDGRNVIAADRLRTLLARDADDPLYAHVAMVREDVQHALNVLEGRSS